MCKLLNNDKFIKKATEIHGNKYDYSKVIYLGTFIKVTIICPIHGEFLQTPRDHIQRCGCRLCGYLNNNNNSKINKEEFIKRSKNIHGDKYNYNKVIYFNSRTKVTIICPIHGEFDQLPILHLSGSGCTKCKYLIISDKLKYTKEQFIEKAKLIHDNKYNYDKVQYINSQTKVIITCLKHGDFHQKPNNHLQSKGCPICNASKGELALEEIFKKHNIEAEPQYNIPEIDANYEVDFYLPDFRILIEFHGKQHYEYIPFFHDGNYTFEDQKTRDALVRDAAIRFKYKYLEFNYKQLKYMTKDQFEQMVIRQINCI